MEKFLPHQKHTIDKLVELAELVTALNMATREQEIYDIATKYVPSLIQTDRSTITLLDETRTKLKFISLFGEKGKSRSEDYIPVKGTSIEEAIEQKAVITKFAQPGTEFGGLKVVMNVPLTISDQIFGTLNLGRKKAQIFSDAEQALFVQIAAVLASHIQSQRQNLEVKTMHDIAEEKAQRLAILSQASHKLSLASTENELYTIVRNHLPQLVNIQRFCIMLLDEERQNFIIKSIWGVQDNRAIGTQLSVDDFSGTIYEAIKNGQTERGYFDFPGHEAETENAYFIPLMIRGKALGSLNLVPQHDVVLDDQLKIVEQLAALLASHIQSAHQTEQTKQALIETSHQSERITKLNIISHKLSQTTAKNALFEVATSAIAEMFVVDRASVAIVSEDQEHVLLTVVQGKEADLPAGRVMPLKGSPLAQCIETRKPIILSNISESKYSSRNLATAGLQSSLNVPMLVGNKVIGAVNIASKNYAEYDDHDANLLLQIAAF